jgi:hypothetical protein
LGTTRERRGSTIHADPHRGRWGAVVALVGIAGLCLSAERADSTSGAVAEKAIPLKPSITFVKASFLTGELEGLRVVERVEHGTEAVAGVPMLRATLTISNDSRNQAARLLGGKIEYIDATGKPIPTADTSFVFRRTATDRLDPGQTVSQALEIPFPMTALQPHGLREVSLELTYLPIPYQTDTVTTARWKAK